MFSHLFREKNNHEVIWGQLAPMIATGALDNPPGEVLDALKEHANDTEIAHEQLKQAYRAENVKYQTKLLPALEKATEDCEAGQKIVKSTEDQLDAGTKGRD
eukprot:scaffold4503_cov167-Amphora_coffeaeformis.AAC.2